MHEGDSIPLSLLALIIIILGNLCLFDVGVGGVVFYCFNFELRLLSSLNVFQVLSIPSIK